MQTLKGNELLAIRPYYEAAAEVASQARCHRAKCGTVIVNNGVIIGRGYNGPPLDEESRRTCDEAFDLAIKPRYDKTCCIHAEWRAILDACKHNADEIRGSTLYFMRVDKDGGFTDAGLPLLHDLQPPGSRIGRGFFRTVDRKRSPGV
jgi:hypothetical protein